MEGGRAASTFGAMLASEQRRVAKLGQTWLLQYVAATTVPFVYLDYYFPGAEWSYVWMSFFSWASGYLLLIGLMDRGGLDMRAGIGSYFAVSAVAGSAIFIGVIAFVLPGLYLLLRWLPVYVRCLASDDWIGSSMRWSWNATQPFQKELAIGLVWPFGMFLAGYLVASSYDYLPLEGDVAYLAYSATINLASSVGYAWLTVLGVASYLAITRALDTTVGEQTAVADIGSGLPASEG